MDWQRLCQLRSLSDSGQNEEALSGLRALLAKTNVSEERAAILVSVSVCLRNLGQREGARKTLRETLSLVHSDSQGYPWMLLCDAGLDMDEGKWKDALAKFDTLLSDFGALLQLPENRGFLQDIERKRGIALLGLDRPNEARPLLERAASGEFEIATVLYCLGKCHYKLDDFENAKNCLGRAIALDLDLGYQVDAHYYLGLAYYRQRQAAWAILEFEWCLDHSDGTGVPTDYILKAKALAQQELAS